jgi:hypothetical protein
VNVPWSIEYKSWWIKIYHILQYTNGSIHLLYRVRDIGPCEPLVFILTLFTLDRIICLLCLYICHYIFPFYYLDIFFIFIFILFDTLRQKALLYKSSRKHTICMCWKFWDFSSFVYCKHLPVYSWTIILQL